MIIKLAALHDGVNNLTLETKTSELGFENDEMSLFFPEKIVAEIEVQKLNDRFYIKTKLFTRAHFLCDRCADDYIHNLKCTFLLYYLKSIEDKEKENGSNYRFLPANSREINVTEDVFENLRLAVPMKRLCRESCLGLCSNCGENLNTVRCTCDQEKIDPRWEKLKNLKQM